MGRPKKNLAKENQVEADIFFSDITLAETEGEFDKVQEIMNEDEILGKHQWVIKTRMTISSLYGDGDFIIDFYWDKKVYIVEYRGDLKDPYSNFDIRCLSSWCQISGWEMPEPIESLSKYNKDFWKYFWETSLLKCKYFDKLYKHKKLKDIEIEENE